MALDTSRDYGTSCGGPTNGFAVQDGKIYNHDGDEVDKNGVPVKPASATRKAAVAKKEPATPELSEQIRAQLECDLLPSLDPADAGRVAQETGSDEEPKLKAIKRKWETTAPFESEVTEEEEKKAELPVQHSGAGMKALPPLKPCPFCGEALVKKSDHHGKWYGHRDEVGECWASIAQIHDEVDAKRWNARSEKALPAPKGLKPKRIAFIDEYMVDRNATQAYIRAGYSANGAQPSSAALLSNPMVAAEVARRVEEYSRVAGITVLMILERLKLQGFTNITEFFDGRRLKAPGEWTPEQAAAVHAYDPGGAQSSEKIKLYDQPAILLKLLDFVSGAAPAPVSATNNVRVNVDKLLLALHAPLPPELLEG